MSAFYCPNCGDQAMAESVVRDVLSCTGCFTMFVIRKLEPMSSCARSFAQELYREDPLLSKLRGLSRPNGSNDKGVSP